MTGLQLTLRIRTPFGMLFDEPVGRIVAEDLDGWFGIAPGRADVVAALPPGLLVARSEGGEETFVALAGGLLHLERGECRVLASDALVSHDLDAITGHLEDLMAQRADRRGTQEDVLGELVQEALRRMAAESRS